MKTLGSVINPIISSANNDALTFSFPIGIPLISFGCLTALAKTSDTILNQYGEGRQPFLVPDFSEIVLCFSSFKLLLAMV